MSNERTQHFIGGELRDGDSTDQIEVVNPATEEVIGHVSDGNTKDVEAAVAAASDAFVDPSWANLEPKDRAGHLRSLADALSKYGEEIATTVTKQNGNVVGQSRWGNDLLPVAHYRYFADLADSWQQEEVRVAEDGTDTIVRKEPYGVVGAIVPWNGPHNLLAWKLGPALAAGNTIVIKPAPETSLDMVYFARAVKDSGIPDGVINFVTGGRDTGAAIVEHPYVRKIGFTGSSAAGVSIATACAAQLKPVTLELGGKSAAIMLDDADAEVVAEQIRWVSLGFGGQMCFANSRLLVPASRYDEVIEAVAESMRGVQIGDPMDETNSFGPLVAKRQLDRVQDYVEIGKSEGARLVLGGGRLASEAKGWYFEPTLFADVDNSMRIAREEIFGPVLSVIKFDDDDHAVRIANDSEYGLGGTVFTADGERGLNIARRVETGSFGVNRYLIPMNAPYGGYKMSGLGRELGPEGLSAYHQSKAIYI